jgi:diadenosine tetraphosphate (Ap4A) HIT family hydrolase
MQKTSPAPTRIWPEDWERRKAGDDCQLCAEGRPDVNSYGSSRVWAGTYSDGYLKTQIAPRGYVIVVWRGRHVAEPTELSREEAIGYWFEVLAVARAIERLYEPAKLNIEILGNGVPHLHSHVVPRYLHDPNPGYPPKFLDEVTEETPRDEYEREAASLRDAIRVDGTKSVGG